MKVLNRVNSMKNKYRLVSHDEIIGSNGSGVTGSETNITTISHKSLKTFSLKIVKIWVQKPRSYTFLTESYLGVRMLINIKTVLGRPKKNKHKHSTVYELPKGLKIINWTSPSMLSKYFTLGVYSLNYVIQLTLLSGLSVTIIEIMTI